jgi:hypothetical protein
VLNDDHTDVLQALTHNDSAGVRRAIEKDIFVAGHRGSTAKCPLSPQSPMKSTLNAA